MRSQKVDLPLIFFRICASTEQQSKPRKKTMKRPGSKRSSSGKTHRESPNQWQKQILSPKDGHCDTGLKSSQSRQESKDITFRRSVSKKNMITYMFRHTGRFLLLNRKRWLTSVRVFRSSQEIESNHYQLRGKQRVITA